MWWFTLKNNAVYPKADNNFRIIQNAPLDGK